MNKDLLNKVMHNRVVHWYTEDKTIACFTKQPVLENVKFTTNKKYVTCVFCLNKIKIKKAQQEFLKRKLEKEKKREVHNVYEKVEVVDDEVSKFKKEIRNLTDEKLKIKAEVVLKNFSNKKISLKNCNDMIRYICDKLSFDNSKYLNVYYRRIEILQERIK